MLTENNIALAAKMYECRATARQLLGEKFSEKMAEFATVINEIAVRDKCNSIIAGATLIKERGATGMGLMLTMAAVVEMNEPSNA